MLCEFATKMQASTCLFQDFYDLTHFSHHMFSKSASRLKGKHISEKRLRALSIKHVTFLTTNGFKNNNCCKCCLLLSLCCSFGSLFVRSLPPLKTACGSTPVQRSHPSPVCKNDGMRSNNLLLLDIIVPPTPPEHGRRKPELRECPPCGVAHLGCAVDAICKQV